MSSKNKKKLKRADLRRKDTIEYKRMKKDNPDVEMTEVILTNIPIDLKCRFKAHCSNRGATMTGKIRQFMTDCIMGKQE